MDIPAELKYISPYVQRGQELTVRDPVVSYYGMYKCLYKQKSLLRLYCFVAQYYAAKLAIAKGPRTKETNEYLSHLLDALETVIFI